MTSIRAKDVILLVSLLSFSALGHWYLSIADSPFDKCLQKADKKAEVIPDTKAARLTITQDNNSFTFDMESEQDMLLDAALKAGADLPFACKGGVCCTCKAKLLEGEVKMLVNYALEPEEVEAGYILTCKSVALSDELRITFDE